MKKTARKKVVRKKVKRRKRKVRKITPKETTRLKRARTKKLAVKKTVRRIIKKAAKKVAKKTPRRKSVYRMTPHELFRELNRIMAKDVRTPFEKKQLSAVKKELMTRVKLNIAAKKTARKNPLVGVNPKPRKSKISPAALRMFRKIHGCDPDKIVKVGSGDENLIVLGEVLEVAYSIPFPTRRDKGDTEWVHKFKKKPILALTSSGKPCIIFMKDHKITDRGLIG